MAVIDMHAMHHHAMVLGISHQLGRGIKAHGLGIEQGRQEGIGMMPLEPTTHINKQCKAGRMRFWKAVFAKALDLCKDPLGKLACVATHEHAVDDFVVEWSKTSTPSPGGHGPSQLIGLAGCEARCQDGQLHDLLLKDGHAQCSL